MSPSWIQPASTAGVAPHLIDTRRSAEDVGVAVQEEEETDGVLTLVVGCVGGSAGAAGTLCSAEKTGGRLLVRWVCGGVDMMESGVSGVGGE